MKTKLSKEEIEKIKEEKIKSVRGKKDILK